MVLEPEEGKIIKHPSMPPMYEHELYPQDVRISVVGISVPTKSTDPLRELGPTS